MLLESLTVEQENEILKEVGYDREKLANDIKVIKNWLSFQHHLPPCRNEENDAFVTNFLIGCKGSIERCKRKLDNYYTIRSQCTQIFGDRDPEVVVSKTKDQIMGYFIKCNKDNTRCFFTWCNSADPSTYDCIHSIKNAINIADMHLRMEGISRGLCIVLDSHNFSTNHILKLNPLALKNFFVFLQEALPYRIKGMIFINAPSFVEATINRIVKPFFKSKLIKRISIYSGGYEELEKHFDKEALPIDLGGHSLKREEINDKWVKHVLSERKWFINEGSQKVNEDKRPKEDVPNSYFGIQGSLRQLTVD